jgi:hypothetical protein
MLFTSALVLAMMADTATPTATPAVDPKKDPNKMICRREVEIGSLVKTRRTCHTRKEWSEMADAARRDAYTLRERSNSITSN